MPYRPGYGMGSWVTPEVINSMRKEADVRAKLSQVLTELAKEGGSSTHPTRLLVMSEPPQIDAGEITDKGYINQRAVLERRADLVAKLYAGSDEVIT